MADQTNQVVVDDQDTFRSATRFVVEMSDGLEVVGEAEAGAAPSPYGPWPAGLAAIGS